MRLFAQVAQTGSFTAAAKVLDLPKQTVSRRFAQLEEALGVQLAHRTTRQLKLTSAGERYAQKCTQLLELADEANREISNAAKSPKGQLHLTADPTYGEAFLSELLSEYLRTYPEVSLELHLTNRHVNLIEEGFDAAFRIGRLSDSSLIARKLGPAKLSYLASPEYLSARGHPDTPRALSEHDCIEFAPARGESRWPFWGPEGQFTVTVSGRIRLNSLRLARERALEGFRDCKPARVRLRGGY